MEFLNFLNSIYPTIKLIINYSKLFDHCRDKIKLVFECGIGTNNPNLISSMNINGKPGAGVVTALSGAHGLIEVDENTDIIKKGDIVNFIPFKEALI